MIGAIIGDVVGSRFEFNNTRDKTFKLFTAESNFTDDTICTVAVADALLRKTDFATTLHEWCRKYPQPTGGYGCSFARWVNSNDYAPYYSFGNGAAMRVSPCAWAYGNASDVMRSAIASADVTHNHPEGIIGAMSTALAVRGLINAQSKDVVHSVLQLHYHDCKMSDFEQGRFDETCQGTVPLAMHIFLESTSFEDAIRRAIVWGGDSDTLAAIVGSLAEAYYGVPLDIEKRVMRFLDDNMKRVIKDFNTTFK